MGAMLRALLVIALGLVSAAAQAQSPAEFYKGKTVNMIVGYSPGGGYDVYARVLARQLGKYIPGNPTVVIQNMPGAGSLRALNFLYTVAPKDGTAIGTFARAMPLLGLIQSGQNIQFDPRKLTWLGSAASYADDAYILIIRKDATVKSLEEARRPGGPPILLGATTESSSAEVMPIVLKEFAGVNIKLIPGYLDSSQLYLAMERGEIEGRTTSLSSVKSTKPDWLKPDGPMQVLAVFGRATRHPEFPNAPTARELASGDRERRLIEVLEAPYALSRPFAAPPDIPLDRAKALQDAFMAAQKDPAYLEEARKLALDVSPITGAQVLAIIERIAATPPDELKSVEKFIEGG